MLGGAFSTGIITSRVGGFCACSFADLLGGLFPKRAKSKAEHDAKLKLKIRTPQLRKVDLIVELKVIIYLDKFKQTYIELMYNEKRHKSNKICGFVGVGGGVIQDLLRK